MEQKWRLPESGLGSVGAVSAAVSGCSSTSQPGVHCYCCSMIRFCTDFNRCRLFMTYDSLVDRDRCN